MTKTIVAVYEDGTFKPLQTINRPEHKHVHLVIIPEEDAKLLESQKRVITHNWYWKEWRQRRCTQT